MYTYRYTLLYEERWTRAGTPAGRGKKGLFLIFSFSLTDYDVRFALCRSDRVLRERSFFSSSLFLADERRKER